MFPSFSAAPDRRMKVLRNLSLTSLRVLLILLAGVSGLVSSALSAEEAKVSEVQGRNVRVVRMVLGIVSYARWPTPHDAYRLCVTPDSGSLRELFDRPANVGDRPVNPVVLEAGPGISTQGCDILYLGRLTHGLRQQLLDEAKGKPVLTISEGDEVCDAGSMFCLWLQGNAITLQLNLDAISRSGIRINPKVLQLASRKPGAP